MIVFDSYLNPFSANKLDNEHELVKEWERKPIASG